MNCAKIPGTFEEAPFNQLDVSPGAYADPKKDAIAIRGLVALALQHERERQS